jgi:hypothetical protein
VLTRKLVAAAQKHLDEDLPAGRTGRIKDLETVIASWRGM